MGKRAKKMNECCEVKRRNGKEREIEREREGEKGTTVCYSG